jgi:flagellar hook-associated protein 2
MALSTNQIAGLTSGFDWRSMIDQLMQVEHSRVDLISSQKSGSKAKLSEWQTINSKLLAFRTSAGNLKDPDDFSLFNAIMTSSSSDVKASDLISVSASAYASTGSYTLKINNLAEAHKISSGSFASLSEAIGADYAGDILINGTVISISSTDTLSGIRDRINDANSGAAPTGVTAGIVTYKTGDYRLILTSDSTGADGIGISNGGSADILNRFGFIDSSRTAKNHLAGGDRSDRFGSTSTSIGSMLGLSSPQSSADGDIVINGFSVGAVNLATDTLDTLQAKFTSAGLTASITTETEDNRTYYRLMISGSANTFIDKNNILEALGIIKGGFSDVYGVTGDIANTSGGSVITSDTLIKDIDGYTGYLDTDYIRLEGTDTDGNPVLDDTFAISDTTTAGDLLAKIESLFGDVTASFTGEGKISISDITPGASPLSVKIHVKNTGGSGDDTLRFETDGDLGSAASIRKRQITAGADASLTVDGVTVNRGGNSISDIISGVTIDMLKADAGTTITLAINRDINSIMSKIESFVSGYNGVISYIHEQTSYDETKQQPGGILFGDGTLASIKSDITSILIRSVWGVSSDFSSPGLVGINVDREGRLSVDNDTLRGYLTTNFNDIRKLFTAEGVTDSGTLEFISAGRDTGYGEYTVHIGSAATRSTSAASDNTALGGNETLTITEAGRTATVSLTSSMTMEQMVNAVNSELAAVYTQVLAGSETLYADAGQAAEITAATKWNSIYDGSGNPAGLVNGDIISFSGTSRTGVSVSGSYTISDIASDSVQGLLSSIESVFGTDVYAGISPSGRITVTDKTSGDSDSSLSFDFTLAHDLDFGTVETGNTGGQAGRYALDISASVDTGDHMVITHNSYGAGNEFTIHQANNLLWTGGDQTVNNGADVSGTINGEPATGNGQALKGNDGNANTAGLSVKYTGTAGNKDAGSVKITLGVAELFERVLFNITDTFEGYVVFKQNSITDQMKSYDKQIEEMEARLDKKREQMIARFSAMETALSKLQNQSTWLAGQINAAYNGWGIR